MKLEGTDVALLGSEKLSLAAGWLREADGLLVTAGAGMGVDSGLPDFRGREGFWRAYPALKLAGMKFEDIASPDAMRRMPTLAWGFYGHRLELYRKTEPHEGFGILRRWGERMEHGLFVFTSNVDGQFKRAGYPEDRIVECHGSIHRLQCFETCRKDIWSADTVNPRVNIDTCRLVSDVPRCARCGEMARPNILMFDDYDWIDDRSEQQRGRLERWLKGVSRLVVVELGAGKAISTVRSFSERNGPRVIRFNPRDYTSMSRKLSSAVAGSRAGEAWRSEGAICWRMAGERTLLRSPAIQAHFGRARSSPSTIAAMRSSWSEADRRARRS